VAKVTYGFGRKFMKSMTGPVNLPKGDAGMLDRVVGVKQPRPGRADLRLTRPFDKRLNPVGGYHLDIVVDNDHLIRVNVAHSEVQILGKTKIPFPQARNQSSARARYRLFGFCRGVAAIYD